MAWIEKKPDPLCGNYFMMLGDGYVEAFKKRVSRRPGWNNSSDPFEQTMAEHLFRLGKAMHVRLEEVKRQAYQLPNPLHVWVVGTPSTWLDQARPEMQRIAGEESSPSYRIVIVGADLGQDREYVHAWKDWAYRAGMRRSKRHKDYQRFHDNALSLLGMMQFHYSRARAPPSDILSHFKAPFRYSGG